LKQSRLSRLAIAVAAVAVLGLALAGVASAADTFYFNNYRSSSLAYSSLDGASGGVFNLGGVEADSPEGTTLDSATGRLYWSSPGTEIEGEGTGAIFSAKLDGSGDGQMLNTTGATVDNPLGVAVDPVNRTIYWSSTNSDTIGYARLDGSGGGDLNTSGAVIASPGPITVDTANGRVYWVNYSGGGGISYANLDGSGGGVVETTGAPAVYGSNALAIDVATGRAYYFGETGLDYVSLDGSGGGSIETGEANVKGPYGLTIDPATDRIYWANYDNDASAEGALAYADLNGLGGGNINPTGPIDGPQDPVILSEPKAAGAPVVSGATTPGSTLSCSTGSWAADLPGQFYYQAPTTYAYRWTLNGAAISGATGSTYAATSAGTYGCTVTAANQAGSAAQTSAGFAVATPVVVTQATVKITAVKLNKKKGTATISAAVSGPGELTLTGKNLATAKGTSHGAGVVKLAVKTKGKGKKTLSKKGKLKLKVKIAFAPSGGGTKVTTTKSVVLKKQATKKK
jgi:hypothetical protein